MNKTQLKQIIREALEEAQIKYSKAKLHKILPKIEHLMHKPVSGFMQHIEWLVDMIKAGYEKIDADPMIYYATLNKQVIGWATVVYESKGVGILHVFVDPQHRRKGLGKTLTTKAIEKAPKRIIAFFAPEEGNADESFNFYYNLAPVIRGTGRIYKMLEANLYNMEKLENYELVWDPKYNEEEPDDFQERLIQSDRESYSSDEDPEYEYDEYGEPY